jgi:hypothetical protein
MTGGASPGRPTCSHRDRFSISLLYGRAGRAGRLTAKNGGSRPGQRTWEVVMMMRASWGADSALDFSRQSATNPAHQPTIPALAMSLSRSPGQNPPILAVRCPVRAHKSAVATRLAAGNAKGASTPWPGPDSSRRGARARSSPCSAPGTAAGRRVIILLRQAALFHAGLSIPS